MIVSEWRTDRCPSLFNNKKYSDVTIYLGKSKTLFPAYRLVLGLRSPYFDDALGSKFKEGITHEFRFEKDSPHALWRVLQYIYTGDYADALSESLDSEGLLSPSYRNPVIRVRDVKTETKQVMISNCLSTLESTRLHICFGWKI